MAVTPILLHMMFAGSKASHAAMVEHKLSSSKVAGLWLHQHSAASQLTRPGKFVSDSDVLLQLHYS